MHFRYNQGLFTQRSGDLLDLLMTSSSDIGSEEGKQDLLSVETWTQDISYKIKNVFLNHMIPKTRLENFNRFKELLCGKDLVALSLEYNIQICVQYASEIQFYNAIVILTQALFDEDGILKPEILSLVKNYLKIPEEVQEKIRKGAEKDKIARTILGSLVFKFIDSSLVDLTHQPRLKLPAGSTPAEEEKVRSKVLLILKTLSPIHERIFQKNLVSIQDIMSFSQRYIDLNVAMFTLIHAVRETLSGSDLMKIKNIVESDPRTSSWCAARSLLDTYGKVLLKQARSECLSLIRLIHKIREFSEITGLPKLRARRLRRFSSFLHQVQGDGSESSGEPDAIEGCEAKLVMPLIPSLLLREEPISAVFSTEQGVALSHSPLSLKRLSLSATALCLQPLLSKIAAVGDASVRDGTPKITDDLMFVYV